MQKTMKAGIWLAVSASSCIGLARNNDRIVPSGQLGLTDPVRKRWICTIVSNVDKAGTR